jgi:translation elongation factor EF-1alpha
VDSVEEIGKVTHYFGKVSVAVVELTATISVGDRIAFKGSGSDFEQEVKSMQIEHEDIATAQAGQAVGLKVENKVKVGDIVYKV